jgi:hypothetical protein
MKGSISDYRIDNDKYWGIYRGVVEERWDKEQLGRCKVRVLGVHDQLKEKDELNGIPTEELPWAEQCTNLREGAVSGNGDWHIPLQGTYVWVFFENGNWMQPRFFASAPGMPELPPNGDEGFNDPKEEWPDKDWLEESDLHRLMRSDKLEDTTLLKTKVPNRKTGVSIGLGGEWEEHWPMYQAKYPDNTISYSHGDIYTEIDNTEGNRRWHVYHPSNSYIEIGEIGQMTIRNEEKRWDLCMDMRFNYTKSDEHRCIDGSRSSIVKMDEFEEINGSSYRKIHMTEKKTVLMSSYHHIVLSNSLWVDGWNSKYVLGFDKEWIVGQKTTFVGIDESHVVGINRDKTVWGWETNFVGMSRESWVGIKDHQKCLDTIHIQAGVEIILEAPKVTLKAFVFDDLAAETNIAGLLKWNAVAQGVADGALKANRLAPAVLFAVALEPPIPPIPPIPDFPTLPDPPLGFPEPPPPPIPPPMEYVDVPPEPDIC